MLEYFGIQVFASVFLDVKNERIAHCQGYVKYVCGSLLNTRGFSLVFRYVRTGLTDTNSDEFDDYKSRNSPHLNVCHGRLENMAKQGEEIGKFVKF